MPPVILNTPKKTRNAAGRLAAAMRSSVTSRIAGKVGNAQTPADSTTMPLFTGMANGYFGETYVPNTNLWCADIRSQLTGVHMGATGHYPDNGGYSQSYGLMPLGDRFAIGCGHGGPEPFPLRVTYVGADGTVGIATCTHTANALDPVVTALGVPVLDLQVYAFSNNIPSFAYRAPIVNIDQTLMDSAMAAGGLRIAISQGNRTDGSGAENCPKNRKVWINATSAFYYPDWTHGLTVGDSGTVEYLLINGVMYFYSVISGAVLGPNIAAINQLISIAATRAGISPITISAVPNPVS